MEWPNYFAGEHRTVQRETIRRCTDFQDAILLELETSRKAPVYTDWRFWYPEDAAGGASSYLQSELTRLPADCRTVCDP